jgi:hypothetical protein
MYVSEVDKIVARLGKNSYRDMIDNKNKSISI